MLDREKVISTLEEIKTQTAEIGLDSAVIAHKFIDKIIVLLKEQEAVEPIKKDAVEITARYEFDCPCSAPLLIGQPYCADCGRSVKWE